MRPVFRRPADHDRARELVALRIDEPLGRADAAWLEDHLAGCATCATVADAYDADRRLFGALRETQPVPPRDLWARTAAAIDAESGIGRPRRAPQARRAFGLPVASLVPIAGVALVAVVVGSTLLNGVPAMPDPSGPVPTAFAVVPGDVTVVTRGKNGSLQVLTAGWNEMCPVVAEGCDAASPSTETADLPGLAAFDNVDAIISPKRDRIVVVQRDPTGVNGVFVVPMSPSGTDDPTRTPRPSAKPSPTPSPVVASPDPTPVLPTDMATASPSDPGASPSEGAASQSVAPGTVEPATPAPPTPSEEPTKEPEPTATVAVTPAPGGAIEIARDVVVVGPIAAYDDVGNRFAFTARPADDSAGPDVYVWDTDDAAARAVTSDHRSVFAGWDRGDLLVSRVVGETPRTVTLNPRTGDERGGRGEAAWLPTVSPDGTHAVWWDGTVRLAADGVTWLPDRGRLLIGSWPDGAQDAEVLARGDIAEWEVRWSPDGTAVAVWITDRRSGDAGRLSLYAVDPDTGLAQLAQPLLEDEPAFAGFSLKAGSLAYTAPGADGNRTVWVLGWDGTSVGKLELAGEGDGTVAR